jgi:hypothetical protein
MLFSKLRVLISGASRKRDDVDARKEKGLPTNKMTLGGYLFFLPLLLFSLLSVQSTSLFFNIEKEWWKYRVGVGKKKTILLVQH